MSENKLPSGIDRAVGQRIRWRRRELKLTQEQLGNLLQLTFQQVQKYERGVNRVSAGRLYDIASALGVPISYFFEGAETLAGEAVWQLAEDPLEEITPFAMSDEEAELIAAFQKISDATLRRSLLEAVKAAALAFEVRGEDG